MRRTQLSSGPVIAVVTNAMTTMSEYSDDRRELAEPARREVAEVDVDRLLLTASPLGAAVLPLM